MVANKGFKSLPAGKFAVPTGKKKGMHDFEGVGAQKPGVSSVEKSGTSGKFAKGGGSGKMAGFKPVKPAKKA